MSDRNNKRQYTIPNIVNVDGTGYKTHFGSYFGPFNEFGEHYDSIKNNYTVDQFYKECNRPFTDQLKPYKQIKSHWFCYQLDWLYENCPGHEIILVRKPVDMCYERWHAQGGWNIYYPIYTWYRDSDNMKKCIEKEMQAMSEFADSKKINWTTYSQGWSERLLPEFLHNAIDEPLLLNSLIPIELARIQIPPV
jgi:hypothetical protein